MGIILSSIKFLKTKINLKLLILTILFIKKNSIFNYQYCKFHLDIFSKKTPKLNSKLSVLKIFR